MRRKHYLPGIILSITVVLVSTFSYSQEPAKTYTDISRVSLVQSLSPFISSKFYTEAADPMTIDVANELQPGLRYKGTIPPDHVGKTLLLSFNVCNNADTAVSVYFLPGFYYRTIELYKNGPRGIQGIPRVLPLNADSIGYRRITLLPHDSVTIIAKLQFVKTYINTVKPRLINEHYLPSFIASSRNNNAVNDVMTYVFCGLLLMMILFSMANFMQGANPEFLYYSAYAFFLGSMLFSKVIFHYQTTNTSYFFESYFDFILQALGIMFYMIFMQRFLDTRHKHPFLYKLYNAGIILIIISVLSYSFFHFFTDNFVAQNLVENITKVLLLIMAMIFIVYSLKRWNDKLMRYLSWGNLCLFIFSLISQITIMVPTFHELPGLLSSSLFYYEIGLFLELVFFLAGLNYKNRRLLISQTKERESLKAQNQLKEYEREMAVYRAQQEERGRISADMHDELGSGLTAIRLLSEITRKKMKEETPAEIAKISASADDVLNKMNAIIWSMNSGNDTLDNLIYYIRAYAQEFFESSPIECKVIIPDHISSTELKGDKRRNIFLSVKETLHNVVKHSEATLVAIRIESETQLTITISDNGKGIDLDHLQRFGNGLTNIRRRMESIGGSFNIENKDGCTTTLVAPL